MIKTTITAATTMPITAEVLSEEELTAAAEVTSTVKLHEAVLPALSVAVMVTTVKPMPNPLSLGLCVEVMGTGLPSLSVAVSMFQLTVVPVPS